MRTTRVQSRRLSEPLTARSGAQGLHPPDWCAWSRQVLPDVELWDSVAGTYAAQVDVDWFDGFLERHLGDVAGKRVLDLGCGHGWFTAMLHERGADVVGVDGSERLLGVARQRNPDVEFEHSDLTEGFEGTFDIVVALMVLMDLPNLAPVRPRVTDGGVLIATILHPAFFLQKTVDDEQGGYRMVRGYLDEEVRWVNTFGGHRHYRRPLGAYIDWAASLGLGVVDLFEPPATSYQGWRSRIPTRLGLALGPCSCRAPPIAHDVNLACPATYRR